MIPFNVALVGAYWERLLVLPLEQRRVAGREPPSEQRLEVQPGFLEESQVHHLRHPAPIMATQPTDLLLTDIPAMRSRAMGIQAIRDTPPTPVLRAMDTQVIRVSPAMDIKATRALPVMPVPRAMGTRADLGSRITPLLPVTDIPATWKTPLTSVHRATNAKAMKVILLTPTHRPMNTTVMRETRDTPVLREIYHRSI